MILIGLFAILILVLFAPFLIKRIEENLEVFLFVMGCIAVTVTSQWGIHLVKEALIEPVKITLAVFIAGILFKTLQKPITHNVNKIADKVGVKLFAFLVIVVLGLLSSVITAIIAALVLVEIISCMALDRKNEINLVVWERGAGETLACGTGACATVAAGVLLKSLDKKVIDPNYKEYFLVYNLGIDGDTSEGLLKRFEQEAKPRMWPDEDTVIIISIGANDAILNNKTGELRCSHENFEYNVPLFTGLLLV